MAQTSELRTESAFRDASEQIRSDLKRAIEEAPEYSTITSDIARLNELRKDGLFAAREARREIDQLQADHGLDIQHQKAADKRFYEAQDREAKRQVVALKYHINDLKKQLKQDHKKELKREKLAVVSLTQGSDVEKTPDFLKQFDLELPDTLKGIEYIRSIDDDKVESFANLIEKYEGELAGLKEELSSVKANSGDPRAVLDLRVKIQETEAHLELARDALKKVTEFRSSFETLNPEDPKYFEKLGELARSAFIFTITVEINTAKALKKSQKTRIEGERKLAEAQERSASKARIEEIKTDSAYLAKLEELKGSLSAAEEIQKSRQAESKAVADEAYLAAKNLFEGKLSEIRAERKIQRTQLGEQLKSFCQEHKGDKEAIDSETEAVYRQLALGGIAETFVQDTYRQVTRQISASVRESRQSRIDSDIVRYYQPEEVVKDPDLIDTNSMRLVIHATEGKQVDVKKIEKRDKLTHGISLFFIYLFLVIMAILVLFPFYWMINTSLKSTEEIVNSVTPTLWPHTVMWSNYVDVFERFDFATYLGNTLVVGIASTVGVLITCILSAFAFARLKFKGRDTVFMIFLATMMIPGEMMVITNYITVSNFGWVSSTATLGDAYLSMILPFCVSVFYIYLLRQNFKQIPEELYLAAKVDGKSDWSFLWTVMVPLCQSTLITIGILTLMGSWNAYVWPNLVASKDSYRLISNGLRNSFTSSSGVQEYGLQMAATVYVTLPLLLLFVIFRKYIMRGVGRAGIKG